MKYIKLVINIFTVSLLIATLLFLVRVTHIGLTAEEFADKRLEVALWFGTAIAAVITTLWLVAMRIVEFITRHIRPTRVTYTVELTGKEHEKVEEEIQDLLEVFHLEGTGEDVDDVIKSAVHQLHAKHCGECDRTVKSCTGTN